MPYWGDVHYDPERGVLRLGSADATTLARAYGTPVVVLNEGIIRRQCRRYLEAFRGAGREQAQVAYAGKALLLLAVCQLVEEEGLALDVVSGGELYTALSAGFPPERLLFHGNNKTGSELEYAVEAGVGRIVVDNFAELQRLASLGARGGSRPRVLLRAAPGVEAHTHRYVATGQEDSKFGFDPGSGQLLEAVRAARAAGLEPAGLHCHIGSQITDLESYRLTARRMLALADELRREAGLATEELDLGGGLAIRHVPEDEPPSVEALVAALVEEVGREAAERDLPEPRLIVEPGRSLVGEAGVTLYTVGSVKRVPGLGTYVAVDGGMMENPRPALYGAAYTPLLLAGAGNAPPAERPRERVAVVGRACESGDVLVHEAQLPRPEVGDLLAVLSTGAYTYSMAGHYNKFPRPAVVLLGDGRAQVIAERERYHDLIRRERPLRQDAKVAARPTRVGHLRPGEDARGSSS